MFIILNKLFGKTLSLTGYMDFKKTNECQVSVILQSASKIPFKIIKRQSMTMQLFTITLRLLKDISDIILTLSCLKVKYKLMRRL